MIEIKLPKLGESISEATVLRWLKNKGESVEKDEPILEVATDKVDSEIAAPDSGVLTEVFAEEGQVVAVGEIIAKLSASSGDSQPDQKLESEIEKEVSRPQTEESIERIFSKASKRFDSNGRFYSPLVRSIAQSENLSLEDLEQVKGSGKDGRVLKSDVLNYVNSRGVTSSPQIVQGASSSIYNGRHEVIEMDRMRSMIADHMVHSKHTAPHVTSYVEADVTPIVEWREANKEAFQKKHGQKITFTPIFVEAVVEALREFPLINVSVDGNKIIVKKDMHIGLATALPNGNLIVPVIKNADQKNLLGLTSDVNDLVNKARTNQLKADEIQGSTFTISNVGTFRNIMGTPIINQPEVAILATGAIRKRPVVVETEYGDMIAIRHMMYLSLSYDHRVVDGNLGGSFLARIGDHLEAFDKSRGIG